MVGTQPEDQLAFEGFAVLSVELCAVVVPPMANAAIANQFASIKEGAGIGAAKKLLTPRAGTDAKQAEGVLQSIQLELVVGYDLLQARVRFFGHNSLLFRGAADGS